MRQPLTPSALNLLFTEARTHHAWIPEKISKETLRELYDLTKWGPTAVNAGPMRVLFLQSEAAKEKLYPALMGSNVAQVRAASVTAIVAYDERFYEHLPRLFPHADVRGMFESNPEARDSTAFRNSSLQGAYLMIAARALGLDVGPMSGFDSAKVDETFFQGTFWKSNFLCNLGYGDDSKLFPRGERLSFEETCRIL